SKASSQATTRFFGLLRHQYLRYILQTPTTSSISVIAGICCVSRETRAEFCQGQALNFYPETTPISTFEHKRAVPMAAYCSFAILSRLYAEIRESGAYTTWFHGKPGVLDDFRLLYRSFHVKQVASLD